MGFHCANYHSDLASTQISLLYCTLVLFYHLSPKKKGRENVENAFLLYYERSLLYGELSGKIWTHLTGFKHGIFIDDPPVIKLRYFDWTLEKLYILVFTLAKKKLFEVENQNKICWIELAWFSVYIK